MAWTPRDFVLYGQYCHTEEIRDTLGCIRQNSHAGCAVLVVRQEATIFQSLFIVTHTDHGRQAQIEALLASHVHELRERTSTVMELLRAADTSTDARYIELQISRQIGTTIKIGLSPSGCESLEHSPMELAVTIFLVGEDVSKYEGVESDLEDLICRVSASAPVRVHQDLATTRDVDLVASFHDALVTADEQTQPSLETARPLLLASPAGQITLAREAEALLQAAMTITGSSVGNVYLATADGTQLTLVACENNPNAVRTLDTNERKSVLGWVHWRQRLLLINNIGEFRRTHPDIHYVWVDGANQAAYAELAVPITYRIPGGTSLALGVINVEKVLNVDQGPYTYKDLAALRELAMRLSMCRINQLFAVSAASLANLTRRSIGHPTYVPVDPVTESLVLDEFNSIRGHLQSIVEQVHELTQSTSVTIRLLSPDQATLIRFCAFPPSVLSDRFADIPLRLKGSVNAWVVRNGYECYIRDLADEKEISKYRGLRGVLRAHEGIRSELCLPIFVSGRVVGSMNLESSRPYAYSETIHLARAIVEQAGLALFQARQEHQRAISSRATNVTVNTHEILKCVNDLVKMGIGNIAERLRSAVDGLGQDLHAPPDSVDQIIESLIAELNYSPHVRWAKRPRSHVLPPEHAQAVRLAFLMVLENAYREAMQSKLFQVLLFADEVRFGGKHYLSVRVNNSLIKPLPTSLLQKLYRVPIFGPDRIHIGSYAAGNALRAIGGDIYVRFHSDDRMVTVAEIPL